MNLVPRLLGFAVLALALAPAQPAAAYTWMVSHGYTNCTQCHFDPAGGGLLTAYGRAQGELLLRTTYGEGELEDPGPAGEFAFGLIPHPESLDLGLSLRGAYLGVRPGDRDLVSRAILMQADARAHLKAGPVRIYGSLGFAGDGALPASLTTNNENNLISREHWIGVDLGSDSQYLVRAGRFGLPYGIRGIEHTMWTRKEGTRTNINDQQQHGVSVSYNGDKLRGEVMAVLGNYQLSPDTYRERGYSAFFEYFLDLKTAVGVSSLLTHAGTDVLLGAENIRQAHGVFARWSFAEHFVLLGEANLLANSTKGDSDNRVGTVEMLQLDWEIRRGLHLQPALELYIPAAALNDANIGGWISVSWFFFSHVDLRIDAFLRNQPAGPERINVLSLLAQLHMYL